jgi:hypothetical protein
MERENQRRCRTKRERNTADKPQGDASEQGSEASKILKEIAKRSEEK